MQRADLKPASYRERIELPVGYEDPVSGKRWTDAEVRAINGADELYVGMSAEYQRFPNDLIYKGLMLSRTIVRIGERGVITLDDVRRLHAQDLRVLEEAVFRLTYGTDSRNQVKCPSCGHEFEAEVGGPAG